MTNDQLVRLSNHELMQLLREAVSRMADRQLFQSAREEILRRLEGRDASVNAPSPTHEKQASASPVKFRKRPVIVEAMFFDGSSTVGHAIKRWSRGKVYWRNLVVMDIDTLEGTLVLQERTWVIKGVKGEFYPCQDEIFRETYEMLP